MALKANQKIIEEIVPPEQSKEEQENTFELFQKYFCLILKQDETIINTPELFHFTFDRSFINVAYFGHYLIPLGVLLQLWRDGQMIDTCDQCQANLYLYNASGSPLSGSNLCSGICADCLNHTNIRQPSFRFAMNVFKKTKANLNKRIILRTRGQFFSFKEGLTGTPVPDEIIEEAVSPVGIEELLCRLERHYNEKKDAFLVKDENVDESVPVDVQDFFKNIKT